MKEMAPSSRFTWATGQGKLRQQYIARRKSVLLFQGQGKLRQQYIARRKSAFLF
ncbi:hypothetical protein [Virgibacillus proomii]|uniref:hypothetical protein n=1 Tax=Virgibacillus proomii TaxID=84407 RepID=UPI001C111653|nr:hypothetical protein [Virgibacillus proomii]